MIAREHRLWLLALLVLVALAAGLAVVSWPQVASNRFAQKALPVGLVLLVCLFGLYTWSKSREMAELRGLVRGLEQRASDGPRRRTSSRSCLRWSSARSGLSRPDRHLRRSAFLHLPRRTTS